MRGIGGNVTAEIQTCTVTRNEIGERVPVWATVDTLTGWLDYSSGDSKYSTFAAKLQESTHVFVADYKALSADIRTDNARMVVNGQPYDILLIDDPMELHYQLEIYLQRTGTKHAGDGNG